MHKVSMIVATLGERPDDLRALLRSVTPQAEFISEIIVVDQHPDRYLLPRLLNEFQGVLPIRHTRSTLGLISRPESRAFIGHGRYRSFPG